MNIDAKDMIQILTSQRNAAQQDAAVSAAFAVGLQRRIETLEKKVKELSPKEEKKDEAAAPNT